MRVQIIEILHHYAPCVVAIDDSGLCGTNYLCGIKYENVRSHNKIAAIKFYVTLTHLSLASVQAMLDIHLFHVVSELFVSASISLLQIFPLNHEKWYSIQRILHLRERLVTHLQSLYTSFLPYGIQTAEQDKFLRAAFVFAMTISPDVGLSNLCTGCGRLSGTIWSSSTLLLV